MDITIQSNSTVDPTMPMDNERRNDSVDVDETAKEELEKLVTNASLFQKSTGVDHKAVNDKGKGKVNGPLRKTIPQPPPPFPQMLKKKVREVKYWMFLSVLKELSMNIPLVESLEQIHSYAKFMNDLGTMKRMESLSLLIIFTTIVITLRYLVYIKEDSRVFPIPCTIGPLRAYKT